MKVSNPPEAQSIFSEITFTADDAITPGRYPVLHIVVTRLEATAKSDQQGLSILAQQALKIISLRRAAEAVSHHDQSEDGFAEPRSKYQEALKSLQDSILPVRAHGIGVFRQLIAHPNTTDPALLPGILDILLQTISEEDSFIYLAAVKALSEMVLTDPTKMGKNVMRRLAEVYLSRQTGFQAQADLDRRLRIGETMSHIVKESGRALPLYCEWSVDNVSGSSKSS